MSSICFFLALLFNSARRSCDCRITSAKRFFDSSWGGFLSMPVGYTKMTVCVGLTCGFTLLPSIVIPCR